MRSAELVRWSVRSAKRDWDIKLPARHREHVWRVVHDLIKGDQRKAERHKFNNRSQTNHRCSHAETRESVFTDWGVYNAPWAEPLEQALAHFVSAIVFRDFFAHEKDIGVALKFLRERFVERLTIRNFSHGFVPLA